VTRRRGIRLGLLVALAVLLGFVGHAVGPAPRSRFPSSLAAAPEGLLAFRQLLERLEISSEIWLDSWEALDDREADGLLLVATPLQRAPTPAEVGSLQAWVARGGGLLVVDDATSLERSPALDRMLANLGLAADAPLTDVDRARLGVARPEAAQARGTPASPSSAEGLTVELHAVAGFSPDAWAVPLAVRDDGVVTAAAIAHGRGAAARVLGALLANDRIAHDGNLDLALRLVADLRHEGVVRFDEYHHGHGGFLGRGRLDRADLLWAAAQGLVVLALFCVARGVRFGPMRSEPPPSRRSSLEFVHSMASLYRRAGARGHVVEAAYARLRREVRGRWMLAEELEGPQLARAVAAASGLSPSRVEDTVEHATQAMAAMEIDEKTMVGCVSELARLEQEALGERDSNP